MKPIWIQVTRIIPKKPWTSSTEWNAKEIRDVKMSVNVIFILGFGEGIGPYGTTSLYVGDEIFQIMETKEELDELITKATA